MATRPLSELRKVLLTGGREVGGLTSFSEALAEGFSELGISAEVIPPSKVWTRWKEIRDDSILKILSTVGIFCVPFARRAICVTHGYPGAGALGWKKFLGHLCADRLAQKRSYAKLVTVSHYAAIHLDVILDLQVDAVICNPVKRVFLESRTDSGGSRKYITYAGRLHPNKNLHLVVPAIAALLDRNPDLHALIVGDGEMRQMLEQLAGQHPRIEFAGGLDSLSLREKLRETKVFVSGCPYEALGITYLEALSQGCNVVMPACGGGLEIAPDLIGGQIQLMPLPLEQASILGALSRAVAYDGVVHSLQRYSPRAVALEYLAVDSAGYPKSKRNMVRSV